MCATNAHLVGEAAAMFHKRVEFKLPSAGERETAIKHTLVRMVADKDIDVGALVEASNHFTMSVSPSRLPARARLGAGRLGAGRGRAHPSRWPIPIPASHHRHTHAPPPPQDVHKALHAAMMAPLHDVVDRMKREGVPIPSNPTELSTLTSKWMEENGTRAPHLTQKHLADAFAHVHPAAASHHGHGHK